MLHRPEVRPLRPFQSPGVPKGSVVEGVGEGWGGWGGEGMDSIPEPPCEMSTELFRWNQVNNSLMKEAVTSVCLLFLDPIPF